MCVLTAVYFIAGKLGLTFASIHPNATAVWACSGIALGTLLIFGLDLWPGILLGAFLVNLTTSIAVSPTLASAIATSTGIAVGNTLEALAGAILVFRFAGGRHAMKQGSNVIKFAILGGIVSATIAATIGAESLILGGLGLAKNFRPIWLTWWLGDAVGVIVVAPLLLLWNSVTAFQWRWKPMLEGLALLVCLVLIGLIVFDGLLPFETKDYPLEYLCVPFLIWAASRFGQREAAAAMLILAATAIWGTLHGFGPFARGSQNESLLLLQAFLGVGAVMGLVLGSEVSERRRAEKEARNLAVVDHLTGLGNYRKLIDTLEAEMKRSDRMKRTFVLILMDLDGLKQINDIHGHPIGNRTLCRLANIMQVHCRSIDTAARYGGDEFALVLPECGMKFGRVIADRICNRLSNDGESPALTVSVGFAVWPYDGTTVDELFREADRALYDMKHRHHDQTLPR